MTEETLEKILKDAITIKVEPDDACVFVVHEQLTDTEFAGLRNAMQEWCEGNKIRVNFIITRGVSVVSLVELVNSLDEGTKNKLRRELGNRNSE